VVANGSSMSLVTVRLCGLRFSSLFSLFVSFLLLAGFFSRRQLVRHFSVRVRWCESKLWTFPCVKLDDSSLSQLRFAPYLYWGIDYLYRADSIGKPPLVSTIEIYSIATRTLKKEKKKINQFLVQYCGTSALKNVLTKKKVSRQSHHSNKQQHFFFPTFSKLTKKQLVHKTHTTHKKKKKKKKKKKNQLQVNC